MLFLWNPTKEDFDYTYGGLSYRLESGKKKRVTEAEGNHVLNALGSRGVTRLVFDDEGKSINEEQIAADAIDRNREFKERQIIQYNERNERRKSSGQPYDPPTKAVRQYAAELGIELLKGYDMAVAEKAQIAKLNTESEAKDKAMSDLSKQIEEQNKIIAEIRKQMIVKPTMPNDMVICTICGDEVMAKTLKSHMNYKHKETK